MVFNGHGPLLQRCDGFNVSLTSIEDMEKKLPVEKSFKATAYQWVKDGKGTDYVLETSVGYRKCHILMLAKYGRLEKKVNDGDHSEIELVIGADE